MVSRKQRYVFIAGTLALLLAFQNCGMDTQHKSSGEDDGSSVAFSTCDGPVAQVFKNTYYPIFSQASKCAGCHTETGRGFGHFASSNFSLAFSEFQSLGRARVERNFINPNHQSPITGPANQVYIDQSKSSWEQAEAQSAQCKGVVSFKTTGKTNSLIYTTSPTDAAVWPLLTWDLEVDMSATKLQGKIPVVITLETRRMMMSGSVVGYEFRNPKARLKASGAAIELQGIGLMINDVDISDFTIYQFIDVSISSTTAVNIAPNSGNGFSVRTIQTTDLIGLSFKGILDSSGHPIQ